MKIIDVQCRITAALDQTGTVRRNYVFIRILTDQGLDGVGEATTEWHEQAIAAQIEHEFKPRLLGLDPTDIEQIWQMGFRDFWWRRGVINTSAMSGIDMACWDIAGKAANLPVFKLLGGKVRDKVRCYVRYGPEFAGRSFEQAAAAARDGGFTAFKHGFGTVTRPFDGRRQVEVAVRENARFRELLGSDVDLMIDAAGKFEPQQAYRLIESLRPLNMLFIEEPTNMDTIEPTLRLKKDFPDIKIALGERMITRWDFRPWFESQAIDVCQADPSHCGGISELMRIAHYAEVYGIQMAPHNPYGPVALAACAHACAAMHNFLILEHCPIQPLFDEIQAVPVPIVAGHVDVAALARRPGLGVELDWESVGSRPYRQWGSNVRRYRQADGSTPMH